jgi:hypothetical protein
LHYVSPSTGHELTIGCGMMIGGHYQQWLLLGLRDQMTGGLCSSWRLGGWTRSAFTTAACAAEPLLRAAAAHRAWLLQQGGWMYVHVRVPALHGGAVPLPPLLLLSLGGRVAAVACSASQQRARIRPSHSVRSIHGDVQTALWGQRAGLGMLWRGAGHGAAVPSRPVRCAPTGGH